MKDVNLKKIKLNVNFGNWPAKYRENFEIIFEIKDGANVIDKKDLKSSKPRLSQETLIIYY